MIVYTGRRGLHIFDIDREHWVFNSKKPGYMYEDIYFEVRDVQEQAESSDEETDEQLYDDSQEEEQSESDESFQSCEDS